MMLVCCHCLVVPIFTCKHSYVMSHLKFLNMRLLHPVKLFKYIEMPGLLSTLEVIVQKYSGLVVVFLCYSLIGLIIFVLPFNLIGGTPNPIMTWSLHFPVL